MSETSPSVFRRLVLNSPPGEWAVRQLRDLLIGALRQGPIPKHVAFVMDGNRRFARSRRMETIEGHGQGFMALGRVLEMCYKCGIKVVTVYAFAVDNFNRSNHEVEGLMQMAKIKLMELVQEGELLDRYGAKVRVLGERALIPEDVLKYVDRAVDMTKHNNKAVLNICFPYASREEMTAAVRSTVEDYMSPPRPRSTMFSQSRISRGIMSKQATLKAPLPTIRDASPAPSGCSDGDDGNSSPTLAPDSPPPQRFKPRSSTVDDDDDPHTLPNPENITAETLDRHMYTAEDPPLDLFIRTSGVERLSNFLCWQCHQDTHIVFVDCLWPDFDLLDLVPIILEWQWKQRHNERDERPPRRKTPLIA